MKVTVNSSLFKTAISTATEALSSRPAKNEWNCVHMQTCDVDGLQSVKITCQDFGICITTSIPCKIESAGAALIPAKLLKQYVALMNGEITISSDSNTFQTELKSGSKKSKISGYDPSDFIPAIKEQKADGHASMKGDDFAELVNGTAFCCSVDQTQMVLTGVHILFTPDNQSAECVGVDGYRLAIRRAEAFSDRLGEINIPAPVAQKIVSIMGKAESISFRFGGGICIASSGKAEIAFSLLTGAYVDYKRLICSVMQSQAKVSVPALLSAVKFANIAASSGKTHALLVQFDQDSITISAAASDNDSVTRVECEFIGQPTKMCFNGRYLEDALNKMDRYCDEAILSLRSPVAPMSVVPVGDHSEDTYYLVLPARMVGSPTSA